MTLLFDGTCGFCTRTVMWINRRDSRGRINIVPCQTAVEYHDVALSREDCATSIWAIRDGNVVAGGAQAAAIVWAVLIDASWPIQVARLPGVRQALDLGYRFIAANRHRLPGIKGMCSAGSTGGCGA